jgi:hypothetical protein
VCKKKKYKSGPGWNAKKSKKIIKIQNIQQIIFLKTKEICVGAGSS